MVVGIRTDLDESVEPYPMTLLWKDVTEPEQVAAWELYHRIMVYVMAGLALMYGVIAVFEYLVLSSTGCLAIVVGTVPIIVWAGIFWISTQPKGSERAIRRNQVKSLGPDILVERRILSLKVSILVGGILSGIGLSWAALDEPQCLSILLATSVTLGLAIIGLILMPLLSSRWRRALAVVH